MKWKHCLQGNVGVIGGYGINVDLGVRQTNIVDESTIIGKMSVRWKVCRQIDNCIIGKLENDKLHMNSYEYMEKEQGVIDCRGSLVVELLEC